MQRRSGFTLVEVLVAMALTLFIMSILSAAFVAATQAFTDLKSAGDLAEKVRGAANVLKRDLEADHCYSDSLGQSPIRLSALWSGGANQPPPASGFFRIYEGQSEQPAMTPGALAGNEGVDLDGIPSYYQTTTSLHYTIGLSGNKRSDFLSATIPINSPLISGASPVYQYPDNYYQDTVNPIAQTANFNAQTAEVAVFLVPVPTGDQTDGTGPGPALPLFALYRRQFLPVPSGWPPPSPPAPAAITVLATQAPNYLEMSTVPTAGETVTGNLTFNFLSDLSKPVRRFWMNRGAAQGTFLAGGNYATMGQVNQNYQASDLLLTDVVSFDVRILVPAVSSDFVDLCSPSLAPYFSGNPAFNQSTGPMVFDTWTNQDDALTGTTGATGYAANWNNPWKPVVAPATAPAATAATIPLYQTQPATGNPQAISIQAIQIVLRVWDFKTKKTRQATIIQQM